jgi:GNAT superfamily N-acetyltransferase
MQMNRQANRRLEYPVHVVLRDSTSAIVRPVEPADAAKLLGGLRRLSPESRVARFFYAKAELTPAELQRFTDHNPDRHIALGLAITDDADHELDAVGIVHCFRDAPGSTSGEVAFAVVDEWQRLGIGTALIQQLALHCWNAGITSWRATFLQTNLAPLKLLTRVADEVITRETVGGALTVECRLRQPALEMVGAGFDAAVRAGDQPEFGV